MRRSLFIGAFLSLVTVQAQERVNNAELQRLAAETEQEYNEAVQIEKEKYAGHLLDDEVSFQGFSNGIPYYYAIDSRNQIQSMNVDKLGDNSLPGIAVTGEGMTVYVWDGGKIRMTHQEYAGRVTQVETTGVNSSHATGVTSVIIGEGVSPLAKGMAPNASAKIYNFTNGNTVSEMNSEANSSENQDYMVSNHSYGSLVGWSYNNNENRWYWYGYPHISETESVLFGFYTANDRNYDNSAYNAPQHSIFKSAGNNRGEGPSGIVTHYAYDENSDWQLFTSVFRPTDCTLTGGYDCLAFAGSVAKNVIYVGAIKPLSGGVRYTGPENIAATDFTSFGPTDDGRIKPEVVAIGLSVTGATNTSNTSYTSWSGTSFSSPAAAGVGVLLQQVKNEFDGGFLRSDMMKALLINTANECGNDIGPDYKFGFGLIDAFGAAETIINANGTSHTADLRILNNESYTLKFTANGTEPLKVSIAWLDPGAIPLPQLELNNRTPRLINDLDLRITESGNTYYPWKLDPDNPSAAATQGDNIVDNVEQIYIENPVAGATYTLTVTHKGNLVTGGQNFALVMNGLGSLLSTDEIDTPNAFVVYPNPVKDVVNIKSDKVLKNAQIRVFNMMGQVIYSEKTQTLDAVKSIDLKHVPAGDYMIYIKSEEGIVTKKIMKY
ncbi:MAG: S8/S53 family peptidase [Weeksellaceae bacterium]|jgi:hypothetical protein|nr:S8/S53 family peptidase [Weeksellaceae bacterium]